jgi:hypothetical protein
MEVAWPGGARQRWVARVGNRTSEPLSLDNAKHVAVAMVRERGAGEPRDFIAKLNQIAANEVTTARDLGERLRVTNAERELLKLWQFKPIDATDEELADLRRAKSRERRKRAREKLGRPSRETYLAKLESHQRPWEALGIHRRTWERRRARAALGDAIIVSKSESLTAAPTVGDPRKRGHQGGALGLSPETQATEGREAESQQSGSSNLRQRLRHIG